MRRVTMVVVLAAVLATAGCATTISGQGRPAAASGGSASGFPSGAGVPSTGSSASSLPGSNAPAGSSLTCTGTAVTASGAPFCYSLPTAFVNATSTVTYPGDADWKTAVQPRSAQTVRDLILVLGFQVADTDSQPSSAIQAEVADQLAVGKANIAKASQVSATTVDGARAFRSTVTYEDGVSSEITLVFRGTTQISVQCQYRTAATQIQSGCTQVVASLKVAA